MSLGLKLLSGYDSDSEQDSEDEQHQAKHNRLPLPTSLQSGDSDEVCDDPSLHDGRIRSFAHKRGNWSSLVYIPYRNTKALDYLFDQLFDIFSADTKLIKIKDPHISLTKTFVLLHHWINEFRISITEKLKLLHSYELDFGGLRVYCNEELTRTFVALTVAKGQREVASSIQLLDECLQEYRLEPFYEEGSFHMSIAWCLGNYKAALEEKITKVENVLIDIFIDNPDFSIKVNNYIFKTGFKEFKIGLR